MTNKEELLRYFYTLDVATLERLKKYSQLLIIPDEDLLVNVNMVQMVSKAHELADSFFPQWTDRSKSDFGQFLVELIALFSEKDFWYINAFANEGTFRKTRSYSNAYSKASSIGYYPAICKGAQARFSVTFAGGEAITYKRGDLVLTVNDMKFVNDSEIFLEAVSSEKTYNISLFEGSQIAEDITYNGYSIFLRKENIDIDSINVIIDNIKFTRVRNFADSAVDSTHFMVLPEEDGSVSIYFGIDGYGVQPNVGKAIRVEYRKCNGASGNLTATGQIVTVNSSLYSREATYAVMLTNASGGVYNESLSSIKEKAPNYFTHKQAAVNEQATQNIINSFPYINKSKVFLIGTDVGISAIPNNGEAELSSEQVKDMLAKISPLLMIGYSPVHALNNYVDYIKYSDPTATGLQLEIISSRGYSEEDIKATIKQVFLDYTSPLILATYGQTLNKKDLDITIKTQLAGIQNITYYLNTPAGLKNVPDIALGSREIFSPIDINKITIKVTQI